MEIIWCLFLMLIGTCIGNPVSQPVYETGQQYVSAQAIPVLQYRQQPQAYPAQQPAQQQQQQHISYITRPVYEVDKGQGLQKYSTRAQQEPIQVQRAPSQAASPAYLQQIQLAQQQGRLQEVIPGNQRKAPVQTLNRQIQTAQPQYLRELRPQTQLKYANSPNQSYKQQAEQQPLPEQQEDYDPNPSYQFGFDVNDDLYTNYQNRKEQREGNKITGSYSVVDSDGFVRTVTYTADPKEGFKAEVTRQPTDIVVKIPKPDPQYSGQYVQAQPQQKVESDTKPNLFYPYQQ